MYIIPQNMVAVSKYYFRNRMKLNIQWPHKAEHGVNNISRVYCLWFCNIEAICLSGFMFSIAVLTLCLMFQNFMFVYVTELLCIPENIKVH